MNEKIGRYTEDEILEHLTEGEGRGFLGRSIYDAIFDKIHALKTENQQLQQENTRLKDKVDKAIKMIEKMTEKELNDITYKGKHYLICGSDFGEGADIILNILKEN